MRIAIVCLCLCAVSQGATGVADPRLAAFDDMANGILAKWRIAGAVLGVSHNGRLVLARGYGEIEGRAVQPDTPFPIGDISKAIDTAAALWSSEEQGRPGDLLAVLAQARISRVASVAHLLRFANALDGRRPPALLKLASLGAIMPNRLEADWWSIGASPVATAFLFREPSTGVDVAVLFGGRPAEGEAFDADVKAGIIAAASSVRQWPSRDLFFEGPELFARDVLNSADYSGGKVSPGEIVVLYPSNAGPTELAGSQLDAEQRIATVTGETRVLFDGIPAPMASAVEGRIGAVVPYGIAGHKTTQVVVEYRGARSSPVELPVVDSTPAIFTLDGTGKGQAAMLNETGCCNSIRNPAVRGSVAALYATGEGQTIPAGIDGDLSGHDRDADLPKPRLPVSVTVGGIPAEITYAGEAPHAVAGLLQVNFRIPADAPVGDAVPLVLHVGATHSIDGVTLAVRSQVQRVLILDSDAAIRDQLTRMLKGAGYEVFTARDRLQAVEQAHQHAIDLLICSLGLPEGERREAVRSILTERTRVRIVATAGVLDPAALKAADLLGAQAILVKPLAAATVLRRVRELLLSRPFPYVADEETMTSFPSGAPHDR